MQERKSAFKQLLSGLGEYAEALITPPIHQTKRQQKLTEPCAEKRVQPGPNR